MLLVIIGAGASYDCLTSRDIAPGGWKAYAGEGRPPLANQLFDPRQAFTEQMPTRLRGLASSLRSEIAGGAALEERLEVLSQVEDDETVRELMALRFYLRDVIVWCENQVQLYGRGGNNFDALIRHLSRWSRRSGHGVCYTTFNYDRLIERAVAADGGPDLSTLASYTSDKRARVYKLHGSVGWVRPADVALAVGVTDGPHAIQHAASMNLGSVTEPSQNQRRPVEVPAIAVPTINKHEFECPSEHLAVLYEDLREVDRILVVGWRGAERHFLNLLTEHLPRKRLTTLVANNLDGDSSECFRQMREFVNDGGRYLERVRLSGNKLPFSGLVGSDELARFLD